MPELPRECALAPHLHDVPDRLEGVREVLPAAPPREVRVDVDVRAGKVQGHARLYRRCPGAVRRMDRPVLREDLDDFKLHQLWAGHVLEQRLGVALVLVLVLVLVLLLAVRVIAVARRPLPRALQRLLRDEAQQASAANVGRATCARVDRQCVSRLREVGVAIQDHIGTVAGKRALMNVDHPDRVLGAEHSRGQGDGRPWTRVDGSWLLWPNDKVQR
mmetsp:Transcript_70950/g.208227  ORF Transcript_70950/g.208227 Transcript_70950/m.208227 type:complete len:217 (-) Transcript_70950:452-1102(-)